MVLRLGRLNERATRRCACGIEITLHPEDPDLKHVGKKECCDDCYYEAIGEGVERRPIGPTTRRR